MQADRTMRTVKKKRKTKRRTSEGLMERFGLLPPVLTASRARPFVLAPSSRSGLQAVFGEHQQAPERLQPFWEGQDPAQSMFRSRCFSTKVKERAANKNKYHCAVCTETRQQRVHSNLRHA